MCTYFESNMIFFILLIFNPKRIYSPSSKITNKNKNWFRPSTWWYFFRVGWENVHVRFQQIHVSETFWKFHRQNTKTWSMAIWHALCHSIPLATTKQTSHSTHVFSTFPFSFIKKQKVVLTHPSLFSDKPDTKRRISLVNNQNQYSGYPIRGGSKNF